MSTKSQLADAGWSAAQGLGHPLGLHLETSPSIFSFVAGSVATGVGLYLLVSILLERRYYRQQRENAQDWKCQPQRFPSARMWQIDLWLGIANITLGSVLSGCLAYYIYTNPDSRLYISPRGHSPLGIVGGLLLYYLVTDWVIYWAHRLYHRPALFRLIHRFHHRNTVPTAFTAFSMHPIEFLTYQSIMLLPLLWLPLNTIGVIAILLSAHVESLVQHSGVRLAGYLPWMPCTYFHDDHHRFFHVNYGQHLTLWDRLHGSLRRYGRRYGIEVFGGRGAAISPGAGGPTAASDSLAGRFVDYSRLSAARVEQVATDAS
jgi:lathosterol oxidase